jgi:hypothetical protein
MGEFGNEKKKISFQEEMEKNMTVAQNRVK